MAYTVETSEEIQKVIRDSRSAGSRKLLVLSGEKAWCHAHASLLPFGRTVSITEQKDLPNPVLPNQGMSILGQTLDCIIFDAFSGFNPDHFAAVSGTIQHGGLLILLCPELCNWPHYQDPSYQKMISKGFTPPKEKLFIKRFIKLIEQDNNVLLIAENTFEPTPIDNGIKTEAFTAIHAIQELHPTTAQQTIIDTITQCTKGHRNRPLVITAARGRGKSTCLGFAIQNIIQTMKKTVIVTAPQQTSAKAIFEQITTQQQSVTYYAPDRLLQEKPKTDLLVIDEAAALPQFLLVELLKIYKRVILATTTFGYEGTGLGFELKTFPLLDETTPGWQHVTLSTPLRWHEGCPLEAFVNRVCLFHQRDDNIQPGNHTAITISKVSRETLYRTPQLLEDAYHLLTLAHYQTRPNHIRQLLDAPDLTVYLIYQDNRLIGLIETITEGGFTSEEANAVKQGKRRYQGHLCAQILAHQAQSLEAVTLKSLRIHRIVIHPVLQKQGLGSLALNALIQAEKRHYDLISTSFAATNELLSFWLKNKFELVRLGIKQETATGLRSAYLYYPLTDKGRLLSASCRKSWYALLPAWLPTVLKNTPTELIHDILKLQKHAFTKPKNDLLKAFVYQEIGLELVLADLIAFSYYALSHNKLDNPMLIQGLIRLCLQNHPIQSIAPFFCTQGKKDTVALLQKILKQPIEELLC